MYAIILVSCSGKKEGELIARSLLKEKLAACVNIIDKAQSLFWWQGKLDCAKEALLVIKTRRPLVNKIIKKVKALHSYEVPEIIALPIIAGYQPYLEWVRESVRR